MSKLSKEQATEEYNKCYKAWEEADKKYQELIKRYIWSGPIQPGQRIPSPPAVIGIEAHKEMEQVSRELDIAKKKLDKAEQQLFDTYH